MSRKNLGAQRSTGSEATKPLPKAGVWGWVKSANVAEGKEET